jgi:putative effector of murein hydrolase
MLIKYKKYYEDNKEKRLKLNVDAVAIIIYQQKQDMKELKNIWSIMSLSSTFVNLLSTLATKTRVKQ